MNHIGGIDRSGNNEATNFPPGTARVRILWWPNQTNQIGGTGGYPDTGASHKVWFAGIGMRMDTLVALSANVAGHVDLKVPQPDFGAGSVPLGAPSVIVTTH